MIFTTDKFTTENINEIIEYARKTDRKTPFEINGIGGSYAQSIGDRVEILIGNNEYFAEKPITVNSSNLLIDGNNSTFFAGEKITDNWVKEQDSIYSLKVEKEVDGLYIDGEKYRLSRFPKDGYTDTETMKKRTSTWKNPIGSYIHALHSRLWGGFSYKITEKEENGNLICVGGTQNNRRNGIHKERIYAENIFEEMTENGEFCYIESEKRIYAKIPDKRENTKTVIITNESVLKIENAENVTVKNLNIKGVKRTFMKTEEPLLRSDWTIYRNGAVYITNSKNVTYEKSHLNDIGTNAIFVDGKNSDIHIKESHICDTGGGGVYFIGRSDSVRNPLFEYGETQSFKDISLEEGPKNDNYPQNCSVSECIIEHVGIIEKQASGVDISIAKGITVKNCSIYNASRAGINIGDGTFGGHLIDGCDVFDCVRETGDHGCFNSWGRDRFWHLKDLPDDEIYKYANLDCTSPTTIQNSRWKCEKGWDIDLDDGSSNYIIKNNLCLCGGIKLREGFNRNVHHNITVNNTVHLHVWYKNSGDRVENNIVFKPYAPILMDNGFGEHIDNNILNCDCELRHADELSNITKTDENSTAQNCCFDENYHIHNDNIKGFKIPTVFGVRTPYLKEEAKEPIIPKLEITSKGKREEQTELFGMTLKNIENEGEMSAFGTSELKGVIVMSVRKDSLPDKLGIREKDVIVKVGEKEISEISDIKTIKEEDFTPNNIRINRQQTEQTI